jgi:ribosomal protein L11 methyltransferase
VHIDVPAAVSEEWKNIRLKPGSGFGDLSHPTTRLVLQMMENIKDRDIIDIGCGSGVLGVYAVALGARHVYAIDIDEEALKHSHENALVNHMEDKISFYVNADFKLLVDVKGPVILMNMVMMEQEQAWDSLKSLHELSGVSFVSGILAEQKQAYLDMVKKWGWKLESEVSEEDWLGLKFVR